LLAILDRQNGVVHEEAHPVCGGRAGADVGGGESGGAGGDAALGALSGAVVLGPIGGWPRLVGYTAGRISRVVGFHRSSARWRARMARQDAGALQPMASPRRAARRRAKCGACAGLCRSPAQGFD